MAQTFLHIQDIGNIEFRKYKSSKRIKIIVKTNSSVKVTMPFSVSYNDAASFVAEKKDWILTNIQKFKEKQENNYVLNIKYMLFYQYIVGLHQAMAVLNQSWFYRQVQ